MQLGSKDSHPSDHPGAKSNTQEDRARQAEKVLRDFQRFDGSYKREAIDQALTLREELTPKLLEVLKQAALSPEDFLESEDDSLAYASILLAYWEEERALPFFLKFADYDEDLLDDLWGDMITQDFQTFLFRTGKHRPEKLKEVIRQPDAYLYIRTAALGALNWCVADGLLSREEMLAFHRTLFTEPAAQDNPDWLGNVLSDWLDLHPADDLPTIESAFRKGLIDVTIAGNWNEVRREIQQGSWERALAHLKSEMKDWMKDDIHAYTSWWARRTDDEVADPGKDNSVRNLEADIIGNPLAKLMKELGVKMRYHELRAYVLGVVLGIELVPPSHVIAEVLLQDTDSEVEFKSDTQAKAFFNLLMELWNELADWPKEKGAPLFEKSLKMYLPKELTDDQSIQFGLQGILLFRRRTEAESFLVGLAEAETFADSIEDERARNAFEWLESYSDRLDVICREVALAGSNMDPETKAKVDAILNEGDRLWENHYWTLEEALRTQQKNAITSRQILEDLVPHHGSQTIERAEPKVGRNDPCPCGSGKKFKKCCLH